MHGPRNFTRDIKHRHYSRDAGEIFRAVGTRPPHYRYTQVSKEEGERYVSGLFESWHFVSLKFSLNDSLDTDLYVLRTDGVSDEDADGLCVCFTLAF